jgi:NADH-quinone oxidoreductase subunit G
LNCGVTETDLKKLHSLVVTAILPDRTTANATVLLPAASWAEKRGSMINLKGRLQRLNQAISSPGEARNDWEILRDLIQAVNGSNGIYTIDELFKQIAAEFSALEGLSLSRIGDLGVDLSGNLGAANK